MVDSRPEAHSADCARQSQSTLPAKPFTKISWERRYSFLVVGLDLTIVVVVLLVGVWVGFGNTPGFPGLAPLVAAIILPGIVCAMVATRAWEARILGDGAEEYNRLIRSFVSSAVVLGMVGLLFRVDSIRGWVFLVIPGAAILALLGRGLLRRPLRRRRVRGECLLSVLVVGNEDEVADLIIRTCRAPRHGWRVTGVCTPSGTREEIAGVPVIGDLDSIAPAVYRGDYQVVAVAPAEGWSGRRLHQLAWDLEGLGVDLVVHPGLMEVTGPRLHVAPVDGLPLLRLTEPTFTGIPRLVKSAVDRLGAALLLVVLTPLLLATYLAVRADGGPGLFRQVRIGKDGQPFRMLKFRTMVTDAEGLRDQLLDRNDGHGPLFKLRVDPRVTPVGALLRRLSLDELPQLVNVLLGSMSLVGPRPPLPDEVALYGRAAHRKLLVKPGLTGLWQISGRSDLSWEESLRLDLRYVENWNLAMDGLILWKTLRAVISRVGAY